MLYVFIPSCDGRLHILRIHTSKMPLGDDVDLATARHFFARTASGGIMAEDRL